MINPKLDSRFEEMRSILEQTALKYGLNHPEVLHLSQELDKIHNELLQER
ncbi:MULTISPECIES: aspartyl-phosphate phosphatase Spo0E family protein [unclassified Paenibacillus]|uniref:Spo0E family sporulation regulatory protein-aspartic acid phosphatase n=1 Tax=Paenibacillus provencensis TaxID=441151 RepID=A0ABW3Q297_9BACL|nr:MULTISPECIES: aspartyl-phosphate phosphatase Spo0E family protein [unclassified Paenibacillus]MCM3130201.1 aspartyl-phosphate phosphatase Spo0E family protein [Paenibacillus sp. MER 78]